MSIATTAKFSELVLLIGDGGSPSETFAAPCVLSSRGIQRNANVESDTVFDCADDEAPGVVDRKVTSIERSISGSGHWTRESWPMWLAWFNSGLPKNIKVRHSNVSSGQPEYEQGQAILTQLNETAERGKKVTAEIEIQFTGAVTVVNKA